jgi:hypothetical protein
MTRVHHWNQNLLLILIGLHVVAVLLYLVVRNDNLIAPMFSGRRRGNGDSVPFASGWIALALFAICAALVATLVTWAG